MKNFLLFNQSFGTEGSPNQTGETLTRENRIGLMSYLRRALMLLFAVLVMSVVNVGMAWGTDVHYVLVSKGYAPLTKKSLDASYNVFKTDGTNIGKVTSISSSITTEGALYYNSTSPTYANLTNTSKYSDSSGDNNTLKGIKISKGNTATISLGSQTFTKIDVIYRCESSSAGTLTIAGEEVATGSTSIGLKSKTGTFSTSLTLSATGQNYRVVVILTREYSPSYTVTYDANGGSGTEPTDANTYEADDPVTVKSASTLSKSGYIFTGWNTRANGTGTPYSPGETMNTGAGNVTLHAQWDTEVDLKYVWKTGNNFCDDNSTSTTTVNMISDNDYFTLTGTGVSQESGSSLNIGKAVGNYFLITAKSGYQISSICFYGKIESTNVNKTTDNSDWSGTIASAGTGSDKRYTFDDINSTYFGVKLNTADKGIYIRNMVITIAVSSSTCADKYSFHYGPAVGAWETPICFEKVGSTHEWNITNFTIPDHTNGQFYVGYAGETNSQSLTKAWTDSYSDGNGAMKLLPGGTSIVGQATGAVGTINMWDDSGWKNQNVGFTPNGYGITYGGSGHAFHTTATDHMLETDVVTLPDVSTTYTMGLATATPGTYVTCAHSSAAEAISAMGVTIVNGGKKAIYLVPGSFNADGAVYAVWDGTNSTWGDGTTKLLTDANGDGIWEGVVASNCSSINLVRLSNGTTASNIDWSRKWNQTSNIGISGDLAKKYTITSLSGDNCSYSIANMQPITGQKGKFRMWDDSGSSNWYVHWIPYYVLSYDANGGSGTTAATERSSESSTLTVSVASNGFTAPTGYTFGGWAISKANADAGTVDYAAGADYSLTSDATLYAVWNCITPDAPTADKISVSDQCEGTGVTFTANTSGIPSYVTWYWQDAANGTSTTNSAASGITSATTPGTYTKYLRAKNTVCDTWSTSSASKSAKVKTAATVSWSAHPTAATVGDGGQTFTVTTNYAEGLEWTLESNTCDATLTGSGTSRTLNYTGAGFVVVKATVTGAGDYCSSAVVSETVTVTAAAAYTVTYNANGGSGLVPTDGNTYAADDVATVLGRNTLAKDGSMFIGWRTAASSGKWYAVGQKMTIVDANVTLYAQWRTISCPSSGTMYSLTMGNVGEASNITAGDSVSLETYATIVNGTATLGNKHASDATKAKIGNANPGKIILNGNDAMLKLEFGCTLAEGDTIKFIVADNNNNQISITTTNIYATSPATSNLGDSYHKYYVVPAESSLIGKNVIYAWRSASSNSRNITALTITRPASCTEPTATFNNGAYTVGGSALNLSTLWTSNSSGAVTYTVKNANGTGASIAGTNFTATSAGTATVTATQAADATYCEKVMDATITVSAGGGYPAGYIYITDVKATPETGASGVTATGGSYDSSLDGSFSHDGYTKWFLTSGASGYYQLNFSPALDVSSYTDLKVDLWWGVNTGSNRGTTVYVNGTSVGTMQVDSKTRYQVVELSDLAVTATSISSIKIEGGGGGGNSVFFRVGVKGTPATPCTVAPTVSATTKGATTSTTQVVNCSGISSLGTGTCTITSYGFVYGTSTNPTLSDSHVEVGTSYAVTGTAFAETTLTGLTPSTTYYVRAYATNGAGTGYGDAVSFTTSAAPAGAPVITVQPTLSEVALGETASFSLTATGATSYQWYSCDSEGENRVEASGASATTDNYSYTTTATGTTYYICKVSNASGDTWSDVVGSIVTPVSFTIHYEAGSTDKTSYTTETFTQTKEVNAAVADYIGSLTNYAFTGVGISDKGKDGTMSMKISMPTSEDAGKYVSFTFTVAPNYYLSVDNIDIQCQPVGNANHNYKVVLTDALGTTITGTSSTNTKGELNSINFPAAQLSGKRLVGLVTVKIFGWYSSSDTYRLAKDTYITGTVSSLPAPTASWTARPASATVGDGGKTYTLTTDGTNTVAWTIEDQEGATSATLSAASGLSTTLSGYTIAGSLYVQASVTGDGIHYLSTPATLLRQRVVISADCEETTLISATLSSCTGTDPVTGTPGGTSAVAFESCESLDGGYKMGKNGSYMRLALTSGNFAANDEVKITITKASDQGDGALHIYKYADASWTELGSVAAAGAGTYTYRLTESNVATDFNTIGLYRTGSNQNPYVKALSVVRNSCSASKPSGVTVTASPTGPYAIGATPTLTVTATNADTYQWYSNTNNTASDGFLLVGETATTYSPSTAIAGTTYYYCVATNASGSTVSNIITVTVNSAKTAPTVSWTDTDESPNYGGGGYAVKATVSTAEWDGTLTTDMLTASDGVTLSDVSVSGKVITATYGVTETARSPLSFSLTLPETTNYTALAANKEISFTRCGEGAVIETTETPLPVLKNYTYTTASSPNYSWQTAGVGWLTLVTGSSSIGSTADSYSGFSYRSNSGKSSITFYSELDAVSAVRVYIKGGGPTTLSKVQKGTTLGKYTKLTPSTDYDYLYSNGSSSIVSREQGYIEITFKTALSANTFVEITLSRNTEYYGVGLITGNSEVGNITTALSWATDPGATVNKTTTDANFRYEAVKASDEDSQASLGTISYKSSNTSVATVSATGVVDILGEGNTRITATLAGSGCYKKATLSYNLVVAEATCTDEAGTITASGTDITIDGNTVTKTDACANVTLTVSGHTGDGAGATYQWYKDGVSMGESYRSNSISVTANGDYTVEVTNAGGEHCTMPATNTITITGKAISITKIVDEWYVKNGRRTPDIALATIEGTTSYTVNDGSSDITTFAGCGFELRDGILYLKGTQDDGSAPSGLAAGDVTLTITAVSACGDDPTATITIHKQVETAKPSIAFIVDGTSGDPVNSVATTKTSSRPIWIYLSESFDLTGCNAYWTNNEKQIRQYYSQFDAIVITDDPNTGTGPKSGKKYVNAIGTMVDIRPILTMEAFVGKYGASSNWHIGGTPSSPNPRQYELKLQCKDHDIYADLTPGANFRSEEIGGETYYYVTMVDNSVTPYAGLADDAETETYPALQGFSAASIKGTGMLGIGTISDGALQGGVERQDEPTARMMILGIQHQAMAALTSEGKQIIKNAIEYLLKTNMEDVNDCSSYFIGTTDNDWSKASNWSSNKLPDASTKARILAPVTVSTKAQVAQLDIAVSGRSIHYNNGETECSGRVTINPTGALIVEGPVRRTTTGRLFTEEELKPTQIEDLTIGSDESNGNGTLIFDNSEGESQAIVQYYSKANTNEDDVWNWQYMAVPFNDNSSAYRNYYDSYLYRWAEDCSGWEVVPNQGAVYPWVGYTITQEGNKTYTMDGTLVETGEQVFPVPEGKNLVLGNSWTAPIQVKQFEDADFAGMSKNVYLFNTGYDYDKTGTFDKDGGRYEGGTYVTIPIHSSTYTGDSLISSLQAFIVYAKADEGGGTFTLDYDRHIRPARTTDNLSAGPMHAPKRGGAIDDKPAVLKVWASGSRYDDRLVVLERGDFSTGLDEGWDGNKRVAGNSSPLIFAVTDNGREAVSAIPTMEGTLIGFWAGEDNEYTLHFEYNEEDELYLLDLDNNTYTPVNSSSTYVFTVPDKKAHNRFILTRNAPDPVATGVEETQANEKPEAKAIKFLKDEKVFIFVNGKLYDATGKIVK